MMIKLAFMLEIFLSELLKWNWEDILKNMEKLKESELLKIEKLKDQKDLDTLNLKIRVVSKNVLLKMDKN